MNTDVNTFVNTLVKNTQPHHASVDRFDAIVIGGGPSGATAAHELALRGHRVLLLDRAGRIKPCGGAIPPRLIADFEIPAHLLVARATCARMVSPSDQRVDIPIEGGFVGMVDREQFDEWLRDRAAQAGALRVTGRFEKIERDADGMAVVHWSHDDPASSSGGVHDAMASGVHDAKASDVHDAKAHDAKAHAAGDAHGARCVHSHARTRCVIGADGANSAVARQTLPRHERGRFVFAYHEIVQKPDAPPAGYDGSRCDVIYDGRCSPDFYGWVFPHGATLSIGTGSADKGFALRHATAALRERCGLADAKTLRREGAPIPLKPLPRWDNGRDMMVVGDAAGVVAPASGEGIYYAMACARMGADAAARFLATGDAKHLRGARKQFMKEHGRVFWVLGIMQRFWYVSDKRRERFVDICRDKDVQQLTFDAYMHKRLVKKRPMAHVRIFFKDVAHLLGLARVTRT